VSLADALAEAVGAPHVLTDEATAPFAIDGRRPRWVVRPGTAEEVGRVLALASAHGLAVAPTGSGTRRHWGTPPRALDLVLSLARLDRILAHEPADLTLSVEAGVTLGAIARHLAPHRQLLPLDPPRAADSTLGGIVATAASGPYRARYGTIRDLLLGVTVVRADGTLVKGGGRVVKNVSGYDMPKLFVGALGTLGVVVAAHLRLHPAPATEGTWRFGFPSPEAVLEAALGIMDAPVVPSRLQLVDPATLAALGDPAPAAATLAVSVGSVPEAVAAQGARIAEICQRAGGVATDLAEPEAWWARIAEATWPGSPEDLTLRIGTRPTDLVKALRVLEAAGGAVRATAETANGVLHATLAAPGGPEGAAAWVARVREGLGALGATAVVEHAPAAVKGALDVWGDVGPALPLMRRVKAELDPQGILNPGRYVGGI
jgi:glycolate oxidase FAD binding subunit